VRQIAQALLGCPTRRQVGKEADHLAQLALWVTHSRQLQALRVQLAVLARLYQLTLPSALLRQRRLNGLAVPARIAVAWQVEQLARQ